MAAHATILLVEDDVALLDGIGDLLEVSNIGYDLQVLKATGGRQCLQILEEKIPDLIISDIMMPGIDGMELIQQIRATPDWVQIPLIFLTAKGSPEEVLEGKASGAARYITKPFDREELVQLVRSQLQRTLEIRDDHQRRIDAVGRQIVQLLNHEIRTPLTYLTVYQQMLTEEFYYEDSDSVLEYLQGIEVGVKRLQGLVGDLITLMKLRSQPAEDYFRQNAEHIEDLNDIIEKACQHCQWRYEDRERDKILSCQVAEGLPELYAIRDCLREICIRLIDNAYKFSILGETNTPKVHVEATADDEWIRISVSDNGIGFPEHVTDDLYEIFYQHNRHELEQQGAGTGLAIVKGFVDLHNGSIEASSEIGHGSVFTVMLPRYQTGLGINGQGMEDDERADEATVLIVEDEWFLLEGLRDLLEVLESGYRLRVLTASDGEDALKVMNQEQPDLIISDIMMPRLDGYQLLDQVRKNPEWIRIPFIFLTAKSERKEIVRGLRSGVEEYITKPYDTKELLRLVSTQLDRYFEKQGVISQEFEELKQSVLDRLLLEFESPLQDLAAYTDKLTQGINQVSSDRELKTFLEGIQMGSQRVAQLAEDYIFMTELRTGEAEENFLLMSEVIAAPDLIEQARFFVEATGFEFKTRKRASAGGDPCRIGAFPARLAFGLQRLAMTLVHSAADVSSRVQFEAWYDTCNLFVQVASNEVNLALEHLAIINELLEKPEAVVPELSEFDPALSVAKGVVHLHNGKLSLLEMDGQGLAFLVQLPAFEPSDS